MTVSEVTYEWYTDIYRGGLPEVAFCTCLAEGMRHVRWMCDGREPADDAEKLAYKRAVCAATEAFADYGDGQVGGFSLGDFKISRYERDATSGTDIATDAVTRELAGTSLLFCGVR